MTGAEVLEHVRGLLSAVRVLDERFPGRSFTLDGHLLGSIGEVLAAEIYGLELLPSSSKCHDAKCPRGRQVQVKLTQRRRVSIYDEPQYLIVLQLSSEVELREVYNGPGRRPYVEAGPLQKNGQRSVSVSKLTSLGATVRRTDRIQPVHVPPWFSPAPDAIAVGGEQSAP